MVNCDVVVSKISHIQESLNRLKEKQKFTKAKFLTNRDVQDIVLFNLQVAIQGCIDIASHIISDNNWGVPGSLAGLFVVLAEKKVITVKTKIVMQEMTGFRNLIVHKQ